MTNLRIILIIVILLCSISTRAWDRQTINYDPLSYQGGTQNWQIRQSDNGWLYVANNNGLLEFNGYSWTLHSMNGRKVRSLSFVNDKIYVGGSNEFGYFKKEQFAFTSLSALIGNNWKGDIWNIFYADGKVYMLDDYHAYVFEDDKFIYAIKSEYKIDCSALIKGTICIGTPGGVAYLDKSSNQFKMKKSSDGNTILSNSKIVKLLPYKDRMIVVTARKGIYFVRKDGFERINSNADNFIQNNQLFSATIQNDILTIGSVQRGLFILDFKNPTYSEIINQDNMLKNNTVLSCYFDRDNNLWLGLDNGIAYINMNNLISPLFSKESPIGTGYCSYFYNGVLYLGTNQGLYTKYSEERCNLVKGGEGQIISLSGYDNKLFSCGDNGILVIDSHETYKIEISGAVRILSMSKYQDKLIVVTYFGAQVIEKKDGKWRYSHTVEGYATETSKRIPMKTDNYYWQADIGDNFVCLFILDENLENVQIKKYSLGNSKVSSNNGISTIDGEMVICTTGGLYRYSKERSRLEKYTELENLLGGGTNYQYLYSDRMKNIWYKSDGSLYLLPHSDNHLNRQIYHIGLKSQMVDGEENIEMVDSLNAVIGTYKGFTMVQTDKVQQAKEPSQVYIHKIRTSKDNNVVSYGKTKADLNLPYELNSISIDWGAFNMSNRDIILFSYRLVGLEEDWSIPTTKNTKEYTNLKEGRYSFEVRTIVKNKEMQIANSDYVTFYILPPWYRSTWAYGIYSILFVIAMYVIYQAIIRKQEREIREKKKTIELQRLLLEEETQTKNQIINELEKEKLQSDLQYKTQELTGYILNIGQKNEMFDKIRKEAELILKTIDNNDNPTKMRKRVSDLITMVNIDIQHDENFNVFKSNFDIVHKDFFKILEKKHPQLTKKDKVLCSYIKMDLLSKEIAPLLNISVRGVEINRYNLRKKMELDRSVNLYEYISSLSNED